ncbi:MAG TPA: FtsX-like permease family protein [Bryobacteraceae bacterium]|nr:FtsX-like permease family protein [Bryobacteraceae bacterium]
MLLRFISESVRRAPRRKALIIAAIAMGSAVATAMLGVMLDIGDKVNHELRNEGANILVTPRGGYIAEAEVPKMKSIFWSLAILGYAPSLGARDAGLPVEGVWFRSLQSVNPAWQTIRGHWAADVPDESMAGAAIARRNNWKPGSLISVLGSTFKVTGIISAGDDNDDRIFIPLSRMQAITGRPGQVDRIEVAALTKPEDAFARKDPKTMAPAELERWSCSNYAISIAHEIEEAIPGTAARPVRRVADSEGRILSRVGGLMGFITLAALLSAGLTVWSLTATTMMERRGEVAIMQAIGAGRSVIATLFGIEMALMGLAGGLIGALVGVSLAHLVGRSVFQSDIEVSWILPFLIMFAAMAIAVGGAAQPLRRTLRMDPAMILREGV